MLRTIAGVFRNGKIELMEHPGAIAEETRVLITVLATPAIDLASHGIDEVQAANLRTRLACFADDWLDSSMDVYDDYDQTHTQL